MSAEAGSAETRSAGADHKLGSRAIFISYRRDDTEGEAGRLYDDLARAYGESSVFMDVSGIQPGLDFRKAIDDNVASCGVLLAVIGPTWATITGHDGARRLDNPSDYVRLEIASALKRGIAVIPVLVHEAHMPALELLPDDLKDLRYRNSVELTHARWRSDVDLLIAALKPYVDPRPARPEATVHATVPVQLPAPQPSAPSAAKARPPFSLGVALGALVVIAALALVFFLVIRPKWEARHQAVASSSAALSSSPASSASTPAASPEAAGTPASTTVAAGAAIPLEMIGVWKTTGQNPPQSDNLEQLSITEFGGQFSVRAYGTCPGKLCDWGTRKLTMDNGFAVSEEPWQPRNNQREETTQRKVSVSVAVQNGTLLVTVKNQVNDSEKGKRVVMHSLQLKKLN
ncbi:MAG TPA: toll/interleukin-1 receptor domain-containing protein [Acidobacteriaceae bacterium]|nr:toll/interleukin-1 receptor domain-containing protein [Acidobacteriaceae bacterium]